MSQIYTIKDSDIGIKSRPIKKYAVRTAVRAVLINKDKVAIIRISKHDYFKIPGGGVERGETITESLKREAMEESGCKIRKGKKICTIIEYRNLHKLKQVSHCYLAYVTSQGKTNYTASERKEGFKIEWQTIDKAIKLFKNAKPKDYEPKFMLKRDLMFLEKAKLLL